MKKIRSKHGPEWEIQRDLMRYLRQRGWLVERTHGNLFQQGFPDLYVTHKEHGQRWIDCKNPVSYRYTKAQIQKWPIWHDFGIGIWIITGATEADYDKLFQPPNWKDYWKPSYDQYLIDPEVLLAEMELEEMEQLTDMRVVEGKLKKKPHKPKPKLPFESSDTDWLDDLGDK